MLWLLFGDDSVCGNGGGDGGDGGDGGGGGSSNGCEDGSGIGIGVGGGDGAYQHTPNSIVGRL